MTLTLFSSQIQLTLCSIGEEVKDASIVVPRSMIIALLISGTLTIGISIALLFSIGDIKIALSSRTNFPVIEIFYRATQSKRATTAMMMALIFTLVFATFGTLASASRLVWAFARDNGLPFSIYFAHVSIYPDDP